MSLILKIFGSYSSIIASALFPLIFIPIYSRVLGMEKWGEAALYLTLLSLSAFLDAGFSQVVSRQCYVAFASGSSVRSVISYFLNIFKRLKSVYLIIFCGFYFYLSYVDGSGHSSDLFRAFLILVFISLVTISNIYRGALIGSGRQEVAGISQAICLIFRYLLCYFSILQSNTAQSLLVAMAVSAVIEFYFKKNISFKHVNDAHRTSFSVNFAKESKNFWILGLAVMLGVFVTQTDKILATLMLDKYTLGLYFLASSLGLSPAQLLSPIVNHFSFLYTNAESLDEKRLINIRMTVVIFFASIVSWSLFVLFGADLIQLWIGNQAVADEIYSVVVVLLIGTTLNALAEVGYMNWIIGSNYKYIFFKNGGGIFLAVLFAPWFISRYGLNGAGVTWLMGSAWAFLLSTLYILFGGRSE